MRASEARVPSTRAWLARLRARETDIKVKGTRPFHSSTVSPPKSERETERERNWFNEFKRGRTNLDDNVREGRPSTATTEDNISVVWLMIETDERGIY
ncbi:hypothetical protein EVAR_66953_1 [Eumeta japonica]|uniref:Uncharacterized protein n=1 Tax=Eumeta variegata TaxID=151549 RepID=A0A4C1ZW44_EUMVA|nr:hypothetical protein EVAR_66953_1 [Eumeta japonica]